MLVQTKKMCYNRKIWNLTIPDTAHWYLDCQQLNTFSPRYSTEPGVLPTFPHPTTEKTWRGTRSSDQGSVPQKSNTS